MESTRTSQLVGLSIPLTFHGQLILGSGSPRRKELLAVLGIPFSIRVADSPEIAPAPLLYRTGFAMGLPLTVDETELAGLPYGLIE